MARSKREEPRLPPGAARDLVDLFKLLHSKNELRIGQIASRTGYAPSHISEVLRGLKSPSPEAAARITAALGGDETMIKRARRRAEELTEWKRNTGKEAAAAGFPIAQRLSNPDVMINIIIGDLFDQDTHIAVGFSDTFDISIGQDRIIHKSSVQGQLLQRVYGGDEREFDEQLDMALAPASPVYIESRSDKPYGKLARYPLGTVVVLGDPGRHIFGVAYGRMGNDLVVRAPVEGLWQCYAQLWEAVYRHGHRETLSIPLMGSGLARVDTLDRSNLLQLILLSFVAYSRRQLICHELRIVISPADAPRVDPVGLKSFVQTL
jgi:transcriptional regulator with XRE-family HTH domain